MSTNNESTAFDPDRGSTGLKAGRTGVRAVMGMTSVCCSGGALALALLGVSQFDLPIVRYVRSVTVHVPWQKLTIPWMAFTSDVGNWIGEGTHLVGLSIVLLLVGRIWTRLAFTKAGVQTLIAHGLVTVVVIGLKHLIGRPRPKFTHAGEWQIDPTWTSGFDSFPSGHTGATFAVATVLAKRFPALAPLCIGIAVFVTLSRVLRGSHFPTDVLMGACLGALSGLIAAAPLKHWQVSFQMGLQRTAIGACAALGLLWSVSTPSEEGISGILMPGVGLVATASGLWLRKTMWTNKTRSGPSSRLSVDSSFILIAGGLASMTMSLHVIAATGLACVAYWLNIGCVTQEESQGTRTWSIARESLVLVGVLLLVMILYGGRDMMPFG